MRIVTVDLNQSYDIHIGAGSIASISSEISSLGPISKLGIVTSPTVRKLHGKAISTAVDSVEMDVHHFDIDDGEEAKSLATVEQLYGQLIEAQFDRQSVLLAVGGGVVGDMTGFAAATYLRGIRFIQVPTTLLAMVDASVGGKTGVNHARGKNLIGAFHQPAMVFVDPLFLATLDGRDMSAGIGEIIKIGAIADGQLLNKLGDHMKDIFELTDFDAVDFIARSCALKAAVVASDERESGRRRILNFGHTIGHALEQATGYKHLRHGEAVAMGMKGALWLSSRYCGLSEARKSSIERLIDLLPLPTLPRLDSEQLASLVTRDKKTVGGVPHFVLLEDIGRPVINSSITSEDIQSAINYVLEQHA